MASTTWVSELPSSAAAWCADARRVWSILIVRWGRRPEALATRRCGNGGGGSQGTAGSRSGSRRSRGPARARRRTRACTACRLMPRASASERSGQPASVSAASVPDSTSLRPDERSSRSRAATRSGNWGVPLSAPPTAAARCRACATYWRSPCVTTSDIVRPSRASRARSRCRCSWSSRNVSSRREPCAFISPRRAPGLAPGPNPPRASRARPRPGRGTGASRRRAAAGSSRAAAP